MPADKQSALAALDDAFRDAVKARASALRAMFDGKDRRPLVEELAGIESGLHDDVAADKHMRALIGKVLGND